MGGITRLLLGLMAAAVVRPAPQINQRQLVGDVLSQLQPAIERALASLSGPPPAPARRFTSVPAPALPARRFSTLPAPRPALPARRFTSVAAPRPSTRAASGASVTSITSSVVSSLQPSIAAAVAQALASSSRQPAAREPEYPAGPARYNFDYKVADEESQAYIAQQESRDGDMVTGTYNYVDPTGDLITVTYKAGPEGYSQERTVQDNAVVMRNVPVGWDGPLAGVNNVAAAKAVTPVARPSSTSQSDLIARILASIQPRITSAVQSAISGSSTTRRVAPVAPTVRRLPAPRVRPAPLARPAPRFVSPAPRFVSPAPAPAFSSGQRSIVSSVVSSLQPSIAAAVSSALSSSRGPPPRRVARPVASSRQAGGDIVGLFGSPGQSSVRVETPAFNIQY